MAQPLITEDQLDLSSLTGGAWVLVDSWTPTAVTTKDFTFDETLYTSMRVVIEDVRPTATTNPDLRWNIKRNNGSVAFGTFKIVGAEVGDAYGAHTILDVEGMHSTAIDVYFGRRGYHKNNVGTYDTVIDAQDRFSGSEGNTWDTFSFFWSTGDFDAGIGNIFIYGLER